MAARKKRRFGYYPLDQEVDGANLVITAHLALHQIMGATLYEVKYLCCSRTDTRTHQQIRERQNRHPRACRFCTNRGHGPVGRMQSAEAQEKAERKRLEREAKKRKPPEPYGITPPTWDKPELVPVGHYLYTDRMGRAFPEPPDEPRAEQS